MQPEMGPPEMERREFPGPDQSWALELAEFCAAIREGRRPEADGRDGLAALELVAQVYARAGIKEGS
jgi:predicted dehydrogenase